jgi:MOSC domain-containing protein
VGGAPQIAVTGLAVAAIKGTRLRAVDRIELEPAGARGNRAFFVIDERGRMVSGKQLGALQSVIADYSPEDRRLELMFPDGSALDGTVYEGEPVSVRFFSHTLKSRLVPGLWSQALSDHAGQPLRLVHGPGAVDRGTAGAASLISRASLERLAEAAGRDAVDGRRFRMLIEIDGVDAHDEDDWVGREVGIGETVVRVGGHVGRCLFTSRNPETGEVNLPTLDILRDYRSGVESTEPLPFGVYGEVVRGGSIRVGDPVTAPDD